MWQSFSRCIQSNTLVDGKMNTESLQEKLIDGLFIRLNIVNQLISILLEVENEKNYY